MQYSERPAETDSDIKYTLALVLAGGRGRRLNDLTRWRVKPAVPFGGEYRIVDFALSNCINSGIRKIGVLTQYKSQSLIRHIIHGWGVLHAELGEFIEILPAQQRIAEKWYSGTADAIYQNIDIIRRYNPDFVLVLAGDHIYKMSYSPIICHHRMSKADLTSCCTRCGEETMSRWMLTVSASRQFLRSDGRNCWLPGIFIFSRLDSLRAYRDRARLRVPFLKGPC
jgi:glucose-1-phosphate adenylyltransferase